MEEKATQNNIQYRKTKQFIGCSERQVDKIENALKGGRRYFGSSGASLTHQINNPIYKEKGLNSALAQVGLAGENKTTEMLRAWMKDKPSCVLIDSVHIKGYGKDEEYNEETGTFDGGDTDHVLIIGNLVLIIDSKNWKKCKKYEVTEGGEVIRAGKPFPGGKLNTKKASHLWVKYLDSYNVVVSPIVVISSEKVYVSRDINWWKQSYRLVPAELLIEFLDKAWDNIDESKRDFINVNLVSSVIANAIKPYNVRKALLGETANLLNM